MTRYIVLQQTEGELWEEIGEVEGTPEGNARDVARSAGTHLCVPVRSWNVVELEDDPTPRFRVVRVKKREDETEPVGMPNPDEDPEPILAAVEDDPDDDDDPEDELVGRAQGLIDEARQQARGETGDS